MQKKLNQDILKRFSLNEILCFSLEDVALEYPSKTKKYLTKVLGKMVTEGILMRLKKGLYHIVPLNEDVSHFIPDWHLVAKYLMSNKKYYIGYYSAMQIHGLITQPSLKEIIVTNVQVKPNKFFIKNTEFQFVHHIEKRFFGFENVWIDDYNKVKCSDLEKTLADVLSKPHYGGGMVEIGKAIYETKEKISKDKLFNYLEQQESNAAIKRYLFLCDLLDMWTAYHEGMLLKIGTSISVFDTTAPDEGKANHKFGLRINIDPKDIREAIYT